MLNIVNKLFGGLGANNLKKYEKIVKKINEYEPEISSLSDEELKKKTEYYKQQYKEQKKSIDEILPEAFATVREASVRALNMRHFDVQLIGGIVLNEGKIAEMKTGEGKTLVSTLPVYLNALTNNGVHIVTVNDYLAKRDSDWMGQIYKYLGLSVGCITNEMDDEIRKKNYNCDLTYGTNNEFGFDYLRDNMKYSVDQMVQRNHFFLHC